MPPWREIDSWWGDLDLNLVDRTNWTKLTWNQKCIFRPTDASIQIIQITFKMASEQTDEQRGYIISHPSRLSMAIPL